MWQAVFSLDSRRPLISQISTGGKAVIEAARPFYRLQTGKRRGGWDAFFDFPPSAPEGTRTFLGEFHPHKATVSRDGERVTVTFDGMRSGIFEGSLRYIFFPGSRLIEQQAAMSTNEPDTAYFYDAGLRIGVRSDLTAGGTMNSQVSYFDTAAHFQTITPSYGSERQPLEAKYRAIAARSGSGSVAVFAAPHQYLFARDYTTNMGYVWYNAWRGNISLGIRQLPDDDSPYYPWMNAPPGTVQEMRMFILVNDGDARGSLDHVLRYTHSDRFPKLPGYVTFAPHWHLAYTMQARDHDSSWVPPFKPAMQACGIDAAMIMDFHGDGHPRDTGDLRVQELSDYYRACRAQSGSNFLLIPAEEANVHLGGHWAVVFPKPVYWYMDRKSDQPIEAQDTKYGKVYRVNSPEEVWKLVAKEDGYVYQTHPRTKGSTGFPDKIMDSAYFRDPRYLGAGWKAMPSDLSSPRLGERAFKTIDDMNNLGLHKRMLGEVDVFQLDSTHELYGHLNINYVKLPSLPTFDHYGDLLKAVSRGDYFITTGEVLLPDAALSAQGEQITATAKIDYTFPLRMAEVVWGDGQTTKRETFPLNNTREFRNAPFTWTADAKGWKWARLAVWDVAGNGAFTNPIWRSESAGKTVVALDSYHNNESKMPDHYQWDGTRNGGFSELGKVLRGLGADLRTLRTPLDAAVLKGVDVLVIVDPDTPSETDDPKYIQPAESEAIAAWVRNGGRLVLLGNDKGNAEFEHLNQLAQKFGVRFIESTYPKVAGKGILNAPGKGGIFEDGLTAYLVEVAPLEVSGDAKVLLQHEGTPIMALTKYGKGQVFALGDPWIYNEYINRSDNRRIATNLFQMLLAGN